MNVQAELARLRAELEREKVDALNYADQMERLRSVNAELVEALKAAGLMEVEK